MPYFFDVLLLLPLMILSFVVTLDKDEDGVGTSFVPSMVQTFGREDGEAC